MTTTEDHLSLIPMPPCEYCTTNPANDGDGYCTPCRAELACGRLVEDITAALENFLDARWCPHNGTGRYYHDTPSFTGNANESLTTIQGAFYELNAAVQRLVELGLGREVVMPNQVKFYGETGFHALVEWEEADE